MKKKPTGKTARTRTKPEKRTTPHADNARNVGARILSLWYHCAEANYRIPQETRFNFDNLYRQEIASFEAEGFAKEDINKGCQMAFATFKELEAKHNTQLAKWKKYLDDLRVVSSGGTGKEYQKQFSTYMNAVMRELEASPADYRERGFAHKQNEALQERRARWCKEFELSAIAQCEAIDQIKEPDALSPIWFMDNVYRDLASKLKTALKLRIATVVNVWLTERHAEQERQYREANPDLVKIAEARRHGIRVELSGTSYENALRFWDEAESIANKGLADIPQDLTGDELDAEARKRIALIEAEIDKAQKDYAKTSRHIPEYGDLKRELDRTVKRAGAEGTQPKIWAQYTALCLIDTAKFRGEELRAYQRERAAKLVLQDGLSIELATLENEDDMKGDEATRGGYKNAKSLEQGMRRHATELGIADKIIKGKRGKHKTA